MIELTEESVPEYVATRLGIDVKSVIAKSLGGGISNHVTLVETPKQRFVVKQSLPKLRVKEDWFSDQSRVFRESSALQRLSDILLRGSVPSVLFEDREHFAYGMAAAPGGSVTWKEQLMEGIADPQTAAAIARIQAGIINTTWKSSDWEAEFGDLATFHQLRLNPYYEVTASRHPDLADYFQAAIQRCSDYAVCLVHGDWSPKNIMVSGSTVMAIDFEVVHYGDPAFDSAFLLNHLVLKSFHKPACVEAFREAGETYWNTLVQSAPQAAGVLETGTLQQLPLLLLARIDGKSPAEYIQDTRVKQRIRDFARNLLDQPAQNIPEIFKRF